MDLYFISTYTYTHPYTPEDLMTKFVDCLVQLPNLRTLDVFSTNNVKCIAKVLKRKSARFPGIRELGISDSTVIFVGNCPNVGTITALRQLSFGGAKNLGSYGGELKRVVGIYEDCVQLGEPKVPLYSEAPCD